MKTTKMMNDSEFIQMLTELVANHNPAYDEGIRRMEVIGNPDQESNCRGRAIDRALNNPLRYHFFNESSRSQRDSWQGFDAVKLKQHMRQLIRLAKDVIEEVEKDNIDHVLICDMAVEELDELKEQIRDAVLGPDPFLNDSSANQIKTGDASADRF